MTARARRTVGVAVATLVVCVAIALYVALLRQSPRSVANASAHLTLQTVAALGPKYKNPDWVSYLVEDDRGKWIHSTIFEVPAHALVQVTIRQYDSATGLRNPFFARAQGTVGGVIRVDGKAVSVINPNLTSHTFAVPQLGVYVPLPGVADDAKNQCEAAPCTQAQAHRTITFTFRTGAAGRYRWQCFVPCAAGFLTGFGGPMQRLGYMDGFLNVV